MRLESFGNEMSSSILPPYSINKTKSPYVSCFSNPIETNQAGTFDSFTNNPFEVPSNHTMNLPKNTLSIDSFYSTQELQATPNFPSPIDLSTLWNY